MNWEVGFREEPLQTVTVDGENFEIFRRDFEGLRVRHGGYVEWPIRLPGGEFRFVDYNWNRERSMPEPNANIPESVKVAVKEWLL